MAMSDYDELPHSVRNMLANADDDFDCEVILQEMKERGLSAEEYIVLLADALSLWSSD